MDLKDGVELGDRHFLNQEYEKAENIYTECLSLNPKNESILVKRSAVYLILENFQAALYDSQQVLQSNPSNTKCVYRTAKALCGLKRYRDALGILDALDMSKFSTADKELFKKFAVKVRTYIKQAETGDYDILSFFRSKGKPIYHDVVNYFGSLKIVEIEGRSRGVIATRDIKPGELLMLEKAFAVAFDNINDNVFVNRVIEILKKCPLKGKTLYQLHAGSKMGHLNPVKDDCSILDADRILMIKNCNAFSWKGKIGKGIWIEPSYINNDCINFNAIVNIYGDVMMVRAVRPITKGSEILITYTGLQCYISRKKRHLGVFDFECNCELCYNQKKEDQKIETQRGILLDYFQGMAWSTELNLVDVKLKADELCKLCFECSTLYKSFYLLSAQFVLALAYLMENDIRKSTDVLLEIAKCQEKHFTHIYGSYGLGGNFNDALYLLLGNLSSLNDVKRGKKLFPLILSNFEVIEGNVGIEGLKYKAMPHVASFISKVYGS